MLQDSLQEQATYIVSVCVRVVGIGVTISLYFGQASRGSNTSFTSISLQQYVDIIRNLKQEWRREVEEENKFSLEIMKQELKETIKNELSQMASLHSPPVEVLNIQVFVARVSTKGSCAKAIANPLGEEPSAVDVATMRLCIVGDQCTRLVPLGKVYDNVTTIHNVHYVDDVVRVSVATFMTMVLRSLF